MNSFFPYYQPIVDLATGHIAGYEVLARYQQGDQVVSAWPYLQNSGYPKQKILDIDRHIRFQALELCKQHADIGFITLNILPQWIEQLTDNDFLEIPTLQMIQELDIPTDNIIIEITESIGCIDKLHKAVTAYQKHGLKVAIDDFGAGASQIDRIMALEPDLIKLDMDLIKQGVHGGITADIALSVNKVAQRAGCQIICEGVENETEFHFALECGADYIQGFIFNNATKSPIANHSMTAQTQALKASYLQRKITKVRSSTDHENSINHCISQLKKSLIHSPNNLAEIDKTLLNKMQALGVLRYYTCDDQATQTSANYNLQQNKVTADFAIQNSNWAHRPYITTLLGSKMRNMYIEVSDIYRDKTTKHFCKTFCTMLNAEQILLVDVLVNDDTLFSYTF